jgi:hypothetical protein
MNTPKSTSTDAYRDIVANGLLSKLKLDVYASLHETGPQTANEVWARLRLQGKKHALSTITPRFAELKRLGVIFEYETRICGVTGVKCWSWQCTGRLPVRTERAPRRLFWIVNATAFQDKYNAEQYSKNTGFELIPVREIK